MKEMIYSPKMLKQPERLAEGEYRGLTYYVLTLGTHPCAYVDVTGTLLDGKGYEEIECDVIDIDCHFGLTYAEPHLSTVDTGGWFIGWDYGHYTDFAGYTMEMAPGMQTGKKWTTEEMVEECKNVIDQIIDKGFANRKQDEAYSLGHENGCYFVQLPCKVGDTLYVIKRMKDKRILPFINEYEVTSISIKKKSITVYHELDGYIKTFKQTDFGETVFLTKEEAEAKMKGGK